MIRDAEPGDAPAIVRLAVEAGLFTVDESGVVADLLAGHFSDDAAAGDLCLVDAEDGTTLAVAYCQALPATDRAWELLMIGVSPAHQRGGLGSRLLREVEAQLRIRDQRLLVVATSGVQTYDRARAFYLAHGYDEEARVRDYYAVADDMVMFRKTLTLDGGRDQP